ncbi:ImmA/IrrE family metallo-endopeptidase [Rhizobium leguminosarum]|uniref:ImmA/IrrE family metallo-endopeptidase n=1 Tax=Rhizobium leguminosarum TaxID=384 RepID=UPI000411C399|nr:ImmA/IrrE family metallo-endopeptidase [Rhizobium leguminosarum]
MNSTNKGDKLEDAFYQYLLDQQRRGELVYGLHPPENCKILRKKEYYCKERGANVQFDIVLELYRQGRLSPHSYVIFECKNYEGGIPETCVTDFSDKLGRLFKHAAKGVLVVSSRLQSGADNVARSRSMGIVKYDEDGLEVVADRSGPYCLENRFVKSQIFRNGHPVKSLKFSAYHDGNFFGTINQFLRSVEPELSVDNEIGDGSSRVSVPYVPAEHIKKSAQEILEQIGYKSGPVDLEKICSMLSIDLHFSKQVVRNEDGTLILGSANFDRNSIQINAHANSNRERFTIGHEIGHFYLKHKQYLRSETIVERDLLIDSETDNNFNYERLEFQANAFSSDIILPDQVFRTAIDVGRVRFDIRDRGHGYIFVDDQPCNFLPYDQLLSSLSLYFEVSKQAIEIKLRKMGLLADQRKRNQASPTARLLGNFTSSIQS